MGRMTFQQAMKEGQEIGSFIAANMVGLRLQGGVADMGVMNVVHQIARNSQAEGSGEFLSRILRLPDGQRNALMEYIQQSRPYERRGLEIKAVLQNQGTKSLRVIVAVTQIQHRNPADGSPSDLWTDVPSVVVLEPGEDIELPPDRAVNALWKHGPNALPPFRWQQDAAKRASRSLMEVAFRASWVNDDGTRESARGELKEWRASRLVKIDEIVAEAKAMKTKSGPEALALLRTIPSWWPKTETVAAMIDKLDREG